MSLAKRSVKIDGHATSITLEDEFWRVLKDLAKEQKQSLASLISEIDASRDLEQNLSSAIRVYILNSLLEKK